MIWPGRLLKGSVVQLLWLTSNVCPRVHLPLGEADLGCPWTCRGPSEASNNTVRQGSPTWKPHHSQKRTVLVSEAPGCSLESNPHADGDKVSLDPSSKLGCFVSVKTQLFFSGVCDDCSASGRCMKTSTSIQHPFSPRQTQSDFNKSKSHTV